MTPSALPPDHDCTHTPHAHTSISLAGEEDDVVKALPTKPSIDSTRTSLDYPRPASNGSARPRQSPSPKLTLLPGAPRLARPYYHTGLTQEELKGSPKQRLEALLSSTSNSPSTPLESTPQTAVLGTLYAAGAIHPPKDSRDLPEPAAKLKPSQVSSRSSPTPPATSMTAAQRQSPQIKRHTSGDSTMSSISSTVSGPTGPHTPSASMDFPAPVNIDPSQSASSSLPAEAVIQRMTKDKQTLAAQNDKLWKLVEKQRAMIIGLNKDLDMLAKDCEKYRKRLHDQQDAMSKSTAHTPGVSVDSISSSRDNPSDLSLRNAPPRLIVGDATQLPLRDDQEQGSKRHVPSPLPLRVNKAIRGGPASPDTVQKDPISPDVASPGGTKKKAPPTPLNLRQPAEPPSASLQGQLPPQAEEQDDLEPEEDIERGRRRTRADDDRAEEENRSRSKKDKSSKGKSMGATEISSSSQTTDSTVAAAGLPNSVGLPSSPRAPLLGALQSPLHNGNMGSLAAMMVSRDMPQMVSAPNLGSLSALKSPGLPMSPRPGNRPAVGPALRNIPQFVSAPLMSPGPMSARGGMLSPRPPRQPIPLPNATQFGSVNPHLARSEMYTEQTSIAERVESKSSLPPTSSASDVDAGPIFRGFMSTDYPNQILPPTALHLVDVETFSSRLRPSSPGLVANSSSDDNLVFSLAVYSRSDGTQVWRAEKTLAALQALDQSLKRFRTRLPDKSLFSGHAPIKLDQRRAALDEYFASLLGLQLDDEALHSVARFLSTDVIGPKSDHASNQSSKDVPAALHQKEGYLAKKGKSWGGWKARYFVLDGGELGYLDSPAGEKIGIIRLSKAQIAYQTAEASSEDSEYRHGFMILEQKRNDPSLLVRHVLCAESDQERDGWMSTLRSQIELLGGPASSVAPASPNHSGTATRSPKQPLQPRVDLQALAYDQTVSAGTPTMGSPTTSNSSESPVDTNGGIGVPSIQTNVDRLAISGPVAGGPIQNASAWGNKPVPSKESKRNIFGFKSRNSEDNTVPVRNAAPIARHHSGRAVFGMNLSEAVELFPPAGVDICLPAPVYRCIEWLEMNNAAQEQGLFRQSGSQTGILSLKEKFNLHGDVHLLEDQGVDCHTIASLLKMYLRELPESVLTRALHLDFLKVLEVRNVEEKLVGLNILVHRLPEANFELLATVFRYLVEVVANQDRNLMGVKNLATIWTAALSIPAPLIDLFITNNDAIFGGKEDDAISPVIQSIDSGSPTSASSGGIDELRSPRKQMFTDLATPMPSQTSFGPDAHPYQQSYDQATMNAQAAFRNGPAPLQQFHPTGDHGFSSLNAALAPANPPSPRSPRSEEASKLVKKGRRESSIRALGISAPLMSPGFVQPSPSPASSGLLSPGLNVPAAGERRKSALNLNRLREMAGLKEES